MLFSPLFIHKVHIYFNSELGFIKKTKGFLNTKRLYFYESMKQTLCVWYCVQGMILYQGARERATHQQALEMRRQDSPRHWIKQGLSFQFSQHNLVCLSPLATLYLGRTTVLNLFLYAYGRYFTPKTWKNATLSYPVTWKQAIEQLANESKKKFLYILLLSFPQSLEPPVA